MRGIEGQDRDGEVYPLLDDQTLLNSSTTRACCGDVTPMCLWRWRRDPRMQFPNAVMINGRNYWFKGELRRWLEDRRNAAAGKVEPVPMGVGIAGTSTDRLSGASQPTVRPVPDSTRKRDGRQGSLNGGSSGTRIRPV